MGWHWYIIPKADKMNGRRGDTHVIPLACRSKAHPPLSVRLYPVQTGSSYAPTWEYRSVSISLFHLLIIYVTRPSTPNCPFPRLVRGTSHCRRAGGRISVAAVQKIPDFGWNADSIEPSAIHFVSIGIIYQLTRPLSHVAQHC